MARAHLTVGVLAQSRKPVTRWARRGFTPLAVLTPAPATPPGTRIGPAGDVETWYAGPAQIALHPGDTSHYRDNLRSARPALWVALVAGGLEVRLVTADPYEGEGLAGDPGLVVEAVAMPDAVRAEVAAFFAALHVEEPFVKRRRQRADPEAMARGRVRVLDLREGDG
jgi:hypothetical protein